MIEQNEIIKSHLKKWDRIEVLLKNDEEKLKDYCERLPDENSIKYLRRQETFFKTFKNLTQGLLSNPIDTIFKQHPVSSVENTESLLSDFINNCIRNEINPIGLVDFIREFAAISLRAYGTIVVEINKPREYVASKSQERENGMPYISIIRLQDVLDWDFGGNGNLEWFTYKKKINPVRSNPFEMKAEKPIEYEITWTKTEYVVRNGNKVNSEMSFVHNWGFVPIIIQATFLSDPYSSIGQSAMEETSNKIIVANNLLNMEFYELAKHAEAVLLWQEDSKTNKNTKIGTDGEQRTKKFDEDSGIEYAGPIAPAYLLKTLEVDRMHALAEYFFRAAIENERDLKSVTFSKSGISGGTAAQSGVAKQVDIEPLTYSIIALEVDLEKMANKIAQGVANILKIPNDYTIQLSREVDVRSLNDKYAELKAAVDAEIKTLSPTAYKELAKVTFSGISGDPEIQTAINEEIDGYEPDKTSSLIDEYMKKNDNAVPPKENQPAE